MALTKHSLDGVDVVTISGGIEVTFAPSAGMVGCSLRHRGEELLGQRGGLRLYISEHSTMGIPLLYPWANRLSSARFQVAGREVVLDSDPPPRHLSRDPDGLPIHGLLSADEGWRVEELDSRDDGGVITASLDFGERPDLLAAFPFPHVLRIEASLSGSKLTIAATVLASEDVQVPISFGFHPYFRLPGVARSAWEIEVPVRRQLPLDELGLPTGERADVDVEPGPLGERTFDDAYEAPPGGAPFVLRGGGRTIAVSFGSGYSCAQVFAPADDDVIAFEPMTAPTNALVRGGSELPLLDPGDEYEAFFSIEVS